MSPPGGSDAVAAGEGRGDLTSTLPSQTLRIPDASTELWNCVVCVTGRIVSMALKFPHGINVVAVTGIAL